MTAHVATPEAIPAVREPTRERTPSDVLLAAARVIEEFGWWDGSEPTDDTAISTAYCAWTAIKFVAGSGRRETRATNRLARHVGGRGYEDVWNWNDAPGRTEAEVIAALREAAHVR